MEVICALGTHKHFLISKTCWIFSILMYQVIIFNNQNQLKTYKIQLHFILLLFKSKIVDSTYKLVILIIHRVLQSCLIVFCLFVTKLSYMLRSVNHYFFEWLFTSLYNLFQSFIWSSYTECAMYQGC